MIEALKPIGDFIHEFGIVPLFCLYMIWRDYHRVRHEQKERAQIIAGLRVVVDQLDAYDSSEDRRALTPVVGVPVQKERHR